MEDRAERALDAKIVALLDLLDIVKPPRGRFIRLAVVPSHRTDKKYELRAFAVESQAVEEVDLDNYHCNRQNFSELGYTPHGARVAALSRLRSQVAYIATSARDKAHTLTEHARKSAAEAQLLTAWLDANPPSAEELAVEVPE